MDSFSDVVNMIAGDGMAKQVATKSLKYSWLHRYQ